MLIDPSGWQPSQELPRGVRVVDLDRAVDDGRILGVLVESLGAGAPDAFDPTGGVAVPGQCAVGDHYTALTWIVPRDGKAYCRSHLREILRRAAWPWSLPGDRDG